MGERIAELVGAAPGQVLFSDSTSVNLFKLVLAALPMRPRRERIISDVLNFPSDLYILRGCLRLLGGQHQLHLVQSKDGIPINEQELHTAVDEHPALINEMNVLPDFREPDNIRLGLAPLNTSFSDFWQAVERIQRTVAERRYLRYSVERQPIT